jgi:Domain of unknown function (DUF4403)
MRSAQSLYPALICLFILVLLAQCQTKKSGPPEAQGFDPPIPPTLSYLAGPITFKLDELRAKINQDLDPVLMGAETEDGRVKGLISFRVKRLTSVDVQYVDHQVKLSAPLQMWLTKPFSKDTTPPKKPFCALHVRFKSTLSVTPNWRLACQTKFTDYEWIKKPEIRLLGGGISLEKLVRNILDKHRTAIESAIDSAVYNELRLDELVRPIWRDMQKPLLISRAYGLWLVPKPISVAAGPISGNRQQLTVPLRIALRTETELKPSTPVSSKTPLPRLQKRDHLSQTSDLNLMSFIPYADINRMLALTINNQNKKLALGTITVNHVSVSGSQHSLIVKADIDGLVNKTVYLKGIPAFDTLTNVLKIENLNFTTEAGEVSTSRNEDSVWKNGLRTLLESILTVRLGDDIAKLPQTINEAFETAEAGKGTDLGIQSFRFTPQRIAIRPDGIQALIKVRSTVKLTVTNFQ